MQSISIVIITKNRAILLEKCLFSLIDQLSKKDEVIVIMDAFASDGTEKVLQKYKKIMPLTYHKSSVQGYPYNYNLGIRKSTKEILVFISDDCVVEEKFIAKIRRAHSLHKKSIIQGVTYSLPEGNIYAEIMGDNYQNWLTLNIVDATIGRMKTIDNKNVSIPREIFTRFGLYDEQFAGGAEDRSFGLRVFQAGVPIIFDSSVVAYHTERGTLLEFIQQHIRIARSESIVDKILPKAYQIKAFTLQKVVLHAQSFIKREWQYISDFRIVDSLKLPILYMILVWVRLYYYYNKQS